MYYFTNNGPQVVILADKNSKIFRVAALQLSKLSYVIIFGGTKFYPTEAEDDRKLVHLIDQFHYPDWKMVAGKTIDGGRNIFRILLVNRKNPDYVLECYHKSNDDTEWYAQSISGQGVKCIVGDQVYFADQLSYFVPEVEPDTPSFGDDPYVAILWGSNHKQESIIQKRLESSGYAHSKFEPIAYTEMIGFGAYSVLLHRLSDDSYFSYSFYQRGVEAYFTGNFSIHLKQGYVPLSALPSQQEAMRKKAQEEEEARKKAEEEAKKAQRQKEYEEALRKDAEEKRRKEEEEKAKREIEEKIKKEEQEKDRLAREQAKKAAQEEARRAQEIALRKAKDKGDVDLEYCYGNEDYPAHLFSSLSAYWDALAYFDSSEEGFAVDEQTVSYNASEDLVDEVSDALDDFSLDDWNIVGFSADQSDGTVSTYLLQSKSDSTVFVTVYRHGGRYAGDILHGRFPIMDDQGNTIEFQDWMGLAKSTQEEIDAHSDGYSTLVGKCDPDVRAIVENFFKKIKARDTEKNKIDYQVDAPFHLSFEGHVLGSFQPTSLGVGIDLLNLGETDLNNPHCYTSYALPEESSKALDRVSALIGTLRDEGVEPIAKPVAPALQPTSEEKEKGHAAENEKKNPLSPEAKAFEDAYLAADLDNGPLDELLDEYDALSPTDQQNQAIQDYHSSVLEHYQKQQEVLKQAEAEFAKAPKRKKRNVYTCKAFRDEIKVAMEKGQGSEIDQGHESFKEILEEIHFQFAYADPASLWEFLEARSINITYGFRKFRLRTGHASKARICFLTGKEMGSSFDEEGIYFVEYIPDHKFDYLKDIRPQKRRYDIWVDGEETEQVTKIPEPSPSQWNLIQDGHYPCLVLGVAGSGKSTVGTREYQKIIEEQFPNEKPTLDSLCYVTYSTLLLTKAKQWLQGLTDTDNALTVDGLFRHALESCDKEKRYTSYLDDEKYVGEEEFRAYFESHYGRGQFDPSTRKKADVLPVDDKAGFLYTYFRGIYKGAMLSWERVLDDKPSSRHLNRKDFDNQMSKEIPDPKVEDFTFSLCEEYESYLEKNGYYDDNDLALAVVLCLEKHPFEMGYLIVDEVQDLTELQLNAIIRLSGRQNRLFFYGDANQTINPTIFHVSQLNQAIKTLTNRDLISEKPMVESFRSNHFLIDYFKYLASLREEWIGAEKNELEYQRGEIIAKDGKDSDQANNDSWGAVCFAPDNEEDLVKQAINSPECMVIVSSEEKKEDVLKNSGLGEKYADRLYTIEEAKGLEWKRVLIYDLLTDNSEKFGQMIAGEARKSTFHRMAFNRYYVACTRAENSFLVLESNISKTLQEKIVGKHTIPKVDGKSAFPYLGETQSPESWLASGDRLFQEGYYQRALASYDRAAGLDVEKQKRACSLMLQKDHEEESAKELASLGYYAQAKSKFEKKKLGKKALLMDAYLGHSLDDSQIRELLTLEDLSDEDVEAIWNASKFRLKNEVEEKKKRIEKALKL